MEQSDKTSEAIEKLSSGKLGDVKILMIEDDSFLKELVLSKLSSEGCIPYSSADGEEGYKLAEDYKPDLVILDLMLPGTQGEEVLKKLKDNPELQSIPVIVFSNKSNQEDMTSVIEAGAEKFLIKSSTDLENLVTIIQDIIKNK